MATMREIADLAGVSTAIVSRILNQDETLSVTVATRERVIQAAKELNYSMKKKNDFSKKKIGIFQYLSEEVEREDPYFLSIRRGIEFECQIQNIGHPVSQYWPHEGLVPAEQLQSCDSVILVGVEDSNAHLLLREGQRRIYVDYCPQPCQQSSIVVNFELAVEEVLNHLTKLGHRQIGFISGTHSYGTDRREAAFETYMRKRGLHQPEFIFFEDWSTHGGYEAMMDALSRPEFPTAFFIASDPMAIGALKALQLRGKRVPEDVAIVGFDDIEMARFVTPALTTVRINTELMGRLAVRLSLNPLDETVPLQVTMPFELIVRDSC